MNSASMPSPYPGPGEDIDGKYRIDRILGEGGMGCVARAYDLLLRHAVAIKFMNPQFMTFPGAVERFIQEGQASVAIKSDHVVHILTAGKLATGAPYLVMPCLEGKDLADLLAADGTPGLPTPRAVHFVLQILRGLQAAHAVGIVHRDMKPSNCFVVRHDGEGDFVKILDFGISKVVQPGSASLTQTNSALGTPLYMSPEQAKSPRDVDQRTDLYSVGVILYELLTGHTPFFSESGEFTEILFKLFTADPPPVKSTRPDLPDELAAAVHKGLAREPNDRYPDAAAFAEAIAPFADERSATVISRIRAFKPEQAKSIRPPSNMALPPSMVAFSQLDAKPQTDVMVNRPTTDIQRGAPATAMMEGAPGQVPARTAMPSSPEHMSVLPPTLEARARPDDAMARTQFESNPDIRPSKFPGPGHTPEPFQPQQAAKAVTNPGVSTDLGASRDTAVVAEAPRRSPLVYVLPIFALFGMVGGVAFFAAQSKASKDTTSSGTSSSTSTAGNATPPPSASTLPPATAATNASPPQTPPSAASSVAETPKPPTSATAKAPPHTTTSTSQPHPTPHTTSVVQTGIKE